MMKLKINNDKNRLALPVLLSLALITILIIVYKDFIFFNSFFLFKDIGSDSINAALPMWRDLAEIYGNDGLFNTGWSFTRGMGQSAFSRTGDPFILLQCYLFDSANIHYGFAFMEILKIFVFVTLFYLYQKQIKVSNFVILLSCLLFAFSSTIILGGQWWRFSSQAVYFILLLLAFERLFKDNKFLLFPIAITVIVSGLPTNLYIFGIFLFFYSIFRYTNEYGFKFKGLFILYGKMIALALLGILISSLFLFPTLFEILNSPRVGGEAGYFEKLSSVPFFAFENEFIQSFNNGLTYNHLKTSILRFFSNDLQGPGSSFRGWHNYLEAPMFYIGLITLLLVPQIFSFLNKRQKYIYGIFLGFWGLIIIFPFFRYAFWAFTGDYYRILSLFITFVLLFYAIKAIGYIDKFKKINIKVLIGSIIGLLILLHYPYYPEGSNVINTKLQTILTIFLLAYTVLIFLLSKKKSNKYARIGIIVLVIVELSYSANITVNRDYINPRTRQKESANISKEEWKSRTGYNDHTKEAISYIKERDKSFFRVHKDYYSSPAIHTGLNDAMAFNYYGTSSYNSFNQKHYIEFLAGLDIIDPKNESSTRWAPGLVNSPLLLNLVSSKYLVTKQGKTDYLNMSHDFLTQFNDVNVLQNKYYLPLGFCYDKFMSENDFAKLSPPQKNFIMLRAVVLDSVSSIEYANKLVQIEEKDTLHSYSWYILANDINNRRLNTMQLISHNQNKIEGEIKISKPQILFFSIPYDKGWKAIVNGKEQEIKKVNIGLQGLMLNKGEYKIELEYSPPYFKIGAFLSVFGIIIYFGLVGFFFYQKRKRINSLRRSQS